MPDTSSITTTILPESLQGVLPALPDLSKASSQTIVEAAHVSLGIGAKLTQYLLMGGISIGIILLGWILAKWTMTRAHKAFLRAKISETPAQFLASSIRFAILLGAAIIAIIQLGVPSTSLAAVLGALMLALGLGLKDTLTNVAAGIMLLVNRPFETGDFIQLDQYKGTVKRINLFQTELNTLDNVRIFVPNLLIWNNAIQNYTHNRVRMVELTIGLDYSHSAKQCREAIRAALDSEPLILREPEPFIGMDSLGDNSVNYMVRVWVKTADFGKVRYTLLERMKEAAEIRGLSIPFPQRVIHMVPVEAPKPVQRRKPAAKPAQRKRRR